MNILFIVHENALNGANRSMLNLIDGLMEENNFFVWCRQGNKGALIEELKKRKIKVYTEYFYCWCTYKPKGKIGLIKRKFWWRLVQRPHNLIAVSRIDDFIKENEINLIHLNTSIIDIGIFIKKKYKIPLIWHIREFGKEDFGWMSLCSERSFYRTINQNADKVIVISKALAAKYEQVINPEKLEIVYNGIPVETQVTNKDYLIKSEEIVFLETGVLCEAKGQRIAIEAMRYLKDKGYDNVKLLLAGRGSIEEICKLEDIKELNISFLGQVNNMNNLRKVADVELVCSRCEAFGRVTVEAMMSGLPVIGSNSGGTPELIVNGVTGFVFNEGDAFDLAKKMICFIDNRYLVKKMGIIASQYSRKHFNMQLCVENMDRIYKKVSLINEAH